MSKQWRVTVSTGDDTDAGTTSDIMISGIGQDNTETNRETLVNNGDNFAQSSNATFNVTLTNVGNLEKLWVKNCYKGDHPGWSLKKIEMKTGTDKPLVFPFNGRFDNENGLQHTLNVA